MEELYCILFQDEESPERECRLNVLYKDCAHYVRHTQLTSLSTECGRLNRRIDMRHAGSLGSFDIQTRMVLWKYAAMQWLDGWPTPRASAWNAHAEDGEEEESPSISPLPKEAVHDLAGGWYRFRSHKVQAASLEEAWRLLDAAFQEQQQQNARVRRLAKRDQRRLACLIAGDCRRRPGTLRELRSPRVANEGVFRGSFAEDDNEVTVY